LFKGNVVDTYPKNATIFRDKSLNEYNEIPYIPGNLVLLGSFQLAKYFDKINFSQYVRLRYPDSKLPDNHVIVHARRGDFLLPQWRIMGPLDERYYVNARREMLGRISSPFFILISDDQEYWPQTSVFKHDKFVYYNADPLETLEKMSSGRNFILSGSTFAWWGVYFAKHHLNGIQNVIVPISRMGEGGPAETPDYYMDEFIKVPRT
jgi:hypothetical protein